VCNLAPKVGLRVWGVGSASFGFTDYPQGGCASRPPSACFFFFFITLKKRPRERPPSLLKSDQLTTTLGLLAGVAFGVWGFSLLNLPSVPFDFALKIWPRPRTRKARWGGSVAQGSGFRVQGSGFRVQGSGFRVQGSG
jgi:hypothetical protein